ncbi:MAG: hypothetical protein VXV93_03975, partial [Pseudomonadota bacterium]|nr:hypothetical protein [Pseudomonadota bacterium]
SGTEFEKERHLGTHNRNPRLGQISRRGQSDNHPGVVYVIFSARLPCFLIDPPELDRYSLAQP